jgi:phosphoadenosine phosphosulfate reductase
LGSLDLASVAVALNSRVGRLGLDDRLRLVREAVSGRLCLTTSFGVEDQLLTAAAADVGGIEFVTLDTGRLFPETHDVWRETERRLGVRIRAVAPEPARVSDLVARDGLDGFYDSVEKRRACCGVRKTEPLAKALAGAAGWITGLRSEQSDERAGAPFAAADPDRGLVKISPLFDWTRDAVLAELRARDVPVSALEARGYRSVGCAPCTRALRPGEPERAGRWWWEQGGPKECGLHAAARAA